MKKQFIVCPFCRARLPVASRPSFELAGIKSCPARGRGRRGRHAFHWLKVSRITAPPRARWDLGNVGSP